MMTTLEDYFLRANGEGMIDHHVRARVDSTGTVRFYIHPEGDGDTIDARVAGNQIVVTQHLMQNPTPCSDPKT